MYRITHVENSAKPIDYFDDFSRADMSDKKNLKINL